MKNGYDMRNIKSILLVGNARKKDISDFLDLKLRGISGFYPPRIIIAAEESEAVETLKNEPVSLAIIDGRPNGHSPAQHQYSNLIRTAKDRNVRTLLVVSDYATGKEYADQTDKVLQMPIFIDPELFYPIIDTIEKMFGCECTCRI